jgi:hypothetical protein
MDCFIGVIKMYKLVNNSYGGTSQMIQRLSDGAFIPMSEDNADYQAFLVWKTEGNEPESADE